MPPILAASVRSIPSRTAARDRRRRLWLAFFVVAASRRSSLAEKSVRSLTAAGMARVLPSTIEPDQAQSGNPGESARKATGIITYYNHQRYHESLGNLTPADVYFGRGPAILLERERIKRQTIAGRRLQHHAQAA